MHRGQPTLYLPEGFSGKEYNEWLVENSNMVLRKKAEMMAKGIEEMIIASFEYKDPRQKTARFQKWQVEEFKAKIEKHKNARLAEGNEPKILLIEEEDEEWQTGFVEYMVDTYKYMVMPAFSMIFFLNHPKN